MASSLVNDVALVLGKALRRNRHRNRDDIAERIAGDDAGRAYPLRMFLAVDGDAGLAHGFELAQQFVEPRDGVRRAPLVAGADEAGDGGVVEPGEIGFAVGGAMQRKCLTDGRNGAQPLRTDHLIDEDQMIFFDDGKIDGFLEFVGELAEERPRHRDKIRARRAGEPQDGRAKPHASVRRGGDHEFFGFKRGHDPLHGGARETDPLGDLSKAQPVRLRPRARARSPPRARSPAPGFVSGPYD